MARRQTPGLDSGAEALDLRNHELEDGNVGMQQHTILPMNSRVLCRRSISR